MSISRFVRLCLAWFVMLLPLAAQTSSTNPSATVQVPRLIRLNGTLNTPSPSAASSVVNVTFSLYQEETGGTSLWQETQNIEVDATGHYTVLLGTTLAEGLPIDLFTSGQAQWLGVRPEGQAEQSRIMLVSVPFALKAGDAETLGGKPPSAYVAAAPSATSTASDVNPTALVSSGSRSGISLPTPLDVSGSGTANYVPLWTTKFKLGNSGIYQDPATGWIGVGTTSPVATLTVLETGGLLAAIEGENTGPLAYGVHGRVSGDNSTGVMGENTRTSGNGIGVYGSTTSEAGEGVNGQATSPNAYGVWGNNSANSGTAVGVYGSTASVSGYGVQGFAAATTGTGYGVAGTTATPEGGGVYGYVANADVSGVLGNNTATSGVSAGVYGVAASPTGYGVEGTNTATNGSATGVYGTGVFGTTTSPNGYGVYGQATATNGDGGGGVFGNFTGVNGSGVVGAATTNGSSFSEGVAGVNYSTTGYSNGVYGLTYSPGGVAAYFDNEAEGFIIIGISDFNPVLNMFSVDQSGNGYFNGNLAVLGAISAGTKDFRIDHPLDPANKYLVHASVESSEMKNIYDGVVTTDGEGLATVQLPEWFEALNRDFRYQLTVMGQFAQAIVADKVANHQFRIRTDKPNVEVSWQVTGVRQDAFAKANPLQVEEEKASYDRGHYLHPELYGAPKTAGIDHPAGSPAIEHKRPTMPKPVKAVQAQQRALPQPIIPPAHRPIIPPTPPQLPVLPKAAK